MALVDYIPVLLFFLGTGIIIKDLKMYKNGPGDLLFVIGSYVVTVAGVMKASHKLLYCFGIGTLEWVASQFFATQAIGFLLAGIGIMIRVRRKGKAYSFLPTMALVGIMIVGLGALDAGLCYLANKLKKRSALICFIISFFVCLAMGYLSSKDFDKAYMNWIAQLVNICGQGLFFLGAHFLRKAGLKELA